MSAAATAQQYVISTYAGGAPPPAPAAAVAGAIGTPGSIATDATGSMYFASSNLHVVFKLDPRGALTRVAGNSRPGYSGDGGPATSAGLHLFSGNYSANSAGLALDRAGNLFIADTSNHRIRRVSPDGSITTVVGTGTQGFSGDGGPATSAQLHWPWGLTVDGAGNLFLADASDRIRKVAPSGIITTVAGNGTAGFSGDGGPATSAQLQGPVAVAVDDAGNLFIADYSNSRIRQVSPGGIITTLAGNGSFISSGDNGPAASAQLDGPTGVAVDGTGNLLIAEYRNSRVRQISPGGIITTVAGTGTQGFSGDGEPATRAQLQGPVGVAVNRGGELFIADRINARIRKISPSGTITTVAGDGTLGTSYSGDGGPATNARLWLGGGDPGFLGGTAVDSAGNLFIADTNNHRIRKVSFDGIISTVAGSDTRGSSGDGGPATSAQLNFPLGVAVDGANNLFIADTQNYRIRRVSPGGIITTVAGNGTWRSRDTILPPIPAGDGGPATSAQLGGPTGVAVDGAGNLFIADSGSWRIRKVSPSGIITTMAGGGTLRGSLTDGARATDVTLFSFLNVAVDRAGNVFIAAPFDGRVHKVSPSGIITTVAGGGTVSGSAGDGGPATSAHLNSPTSVALDGAGNLFIATSDYDWDVSGGNERIRKVSPGGIITTVAGKGAFGFYGDGGPAASAQLAGPAGLAVDAAGNLYVVDTGNQVVRILRPTNQPVWVGAVVDAASQRADPVSPGKIVVIYGAGLGPSQLIQNQPRNGQLGTELGGTTVSFNGTAAPILYTSATQVAAVAPYAVTGTSAQVTVTYEGDVSDPFTAPVAASAPSLFTLNQAGWGQAAAINAVDGTENTAANPVRIGGFVSLYATGEGQTGSSTPARPVLPVRVTVGGISATVQYAGNAPGQVAGLMQVNVQIPSGVSPGGYVPVVLQVGDQSSSPAVWLAVGN